MQNKIIHYCQSDNELGLYPEFTKLYNAINYILPMNEIQRLIVEKVFYCLTNIPNSNDDWVEDQLLLYICDKGGIKKCRVVYAIKLRYILLSQDSDLIITTPIDTTANNIDGSTFHTSLAIGVRNK